MPIKPLSPRPAAPRFAVSLLAGTRFGLRAALALLALAPLAGCGTGSYPSLARRAGEIAAPDAPATPAAPAAALPAPTDEASVNATVEQALAQARTADADFARDVPAVETQLAAAANTERGSQPWAKASIGLAGLEMHRAQLGSQIALVERLYVDDRMAYPDDTDSASRPLSGVLNAARATLDGMAQAQDRTLARLGARLR